MKIFNIKSGEVCPNFLVASQPFIPSPFSTYSGIVRKEKGFANVDISMNWQFLCDCMFKSEYSDSRIG